MNKKVGRTLTIYLGGNCTWLSVLSICLKDGTDFELLGIGDHRNF